ncbi:MAG: hypothetical protein AVDCRST_MAG31-1721, partial [uncultured Sphingomonas sp.]
CLSKEKAHVTATSVRHRHRISVQALRQWPNGPPLALVDGAH